MRQKIERKKKDVGNVENAKKKQKTSECFEATTLIMLNTHVENVVVLSFFQNTLHCSRIFWEKFHVGILLPMA